MDETNDSASPEPNTSETDTKEVIDTPEPETSPKPASDDSHSSYPPVISQDKKKSKGLILLVLAVLLLLGVGYGAYAYHKNSSKKSTASQTI